jgi:hypothetical protein
MTKELVLVHGRSQERKDPEALKTEWLDALDEGLRKSGLNLPIPHESVRFPFYGDTLYELSQGMTADAAAEVIVRGEAKDIDPEELRFTRAVMQEIAKKSGISQEQIAATVGQDVVERGPQNWEWFQGILRVIDRFVPFGSGSSVALFTRDVYQYLKNSAIRQQIEDGVSQALSDRVETVIVSHSLGTVVAYNLLRREGHLRNWRVPLFVTLGSPLAIGEIRKTLRSFAPTRCPECASAWFNAMDERDVVALYPLDTQCFPLNPLQPAIENKTDVRNRTRNRHGIAGYLDDKAVAKRIHDALI